MAQVKSELFSEKLTQLSSLFKALSHPARLQILQYLAQQDTCITGDISDLIPLGRTTVNQHIKELKQAGLIKGTICGVKTNYCLHPEAIKEMKKLMENYLAEISVERNTTGCND